MVVCCRGLLPLPAYRARDFLNELMAHRKSSSAAHSLVGIGPQGAYPSLGQASRKRTPSTAAAVRSDSQRPSQRTKYSDYVEGAPVKVVKWSGNSPEEFRCNDLNGKLCDPLPDFFSGWISGLAGPAGNPDKKFLPQPLLTSGALKRGCATTRGALGLVTLGTIAPNWLRMWPRILGLETHSNHSLSLLHLILMLLCVIQLLQLAVLLVMLSFLLLMLMIPPHLTGCGLRTEGCCLLLSRKFKH